ncbi:MAG: hypothetical protein HYT89_07100 [Candidatus Omnitrophica bacterium]|nr:hypothetical protein [Candidatus Omnitrophota bacterium]
MKKKAVCLLFFLGLLAGASQAGGKELLKLQRTIPLEKITGRLGHMAFDAEKERLYVPARDNNTLHVLDLKLGKSVFNLAGLIEPYDVLYHPLYRKFYVNEVKKGYCEVFYEGSVFPATHLNFHYAAGRILYDPKNRMIYAGYDDSIGVFDPTVDNLYGNVRIAGHPEGMALEEETDRLFVNIPSMNQVAAVDVKNRKVALVIPLGEFKGNYAIALDPVGRRLLVSCQNPAKFLAFDTTSGRQVAQLDTVGEVGDMAYDAANRLIYLASGQGVLQVIRQKDADHYEIAGKVPSKKGGSALYLHPDSGRLFVAVGRQKEPAEIQIFEVPGGARAKPVAFSQGTADKSKV